MRRTVWIALGVTVFLAAAMLLLLRYSARQLDTAMPAAQKIEYYKLYVEVLKAIVVGFGAAILGILIPAILAEARYSFERLRDSRKAYSEAKTAGDYLALRICTLDLKAAAALLQRAHVCKHEAELYPELKQHLRRRSIKKSPEQWGDALYSQYVDVRELLESNSRDWDHLTPDARLSLVRGKIPAPAKDQLTPGAIPPAPLSTKPNPAMQPTKPASANAQR